MFTGGSRVLVDQALSRQEVRRGVMGALVLAAVAAGTLLWTAPAHAVSMLVLMVALSVLALGYTVPPLKLSHRGLGEVTVGVTHSIGVMLCGYVFQGGVWHDAFPWWTSVPFFLAVLPAILLAGIPDVEADRAAGKDTLVVKMGPRSAILLAIACTVLAALTGVLWHTLGLAGGAFGALIYGAVPHGALLSWMLARYWTQYERPGRIDRLIAIALAYIIWFGAVPLVYLL
jgi:1,4-dihydroxy-2-naphthoate octaprenyltransferase